MIVFIIIILFFFPFVLITLLLPEHTRDKIIYFFLKCVAKSWFILIGIKTKIYNKELLVRGKNYIFTPNHNSYLDAAIIYRCIPHYFKTLGKFEISKTPIFGLMYKSATVLVDRSSTIKRAKSFLKLRKEMENKLSMVIFPEGTFNETEVDPLIEFFDGAFRLAIDTKMDIMPLLLLDNVNRMHFKGLFEFTPGWNRNVFLPAIEVSKLPGIKDVQVRDYTYKYMEYMILHIKENGPKNTLPVAKEWMKKNPLSL